MPDYSKAKIYKLTDGEYFYYGSTCMELHERFMNHVKCFAKSKVYRYFDKIGWENVDMILVEDNLNVKNDEQLRMRENFYIEKYLHDEKCLNTRRAYSTYEDMQIRKGINNEQSPERYNNAKICVITDGDYFYIGHTFRLLHECLLDHIIRSFDGTSCANLYSYFLPTNWNSANILLIDDKLNITCYEQLHVMKMIYIGRYIDDEKCLNTHSCISQRLREIYASY